MSEPASIIEKARSKIADDDGEINRRTALVTGSVAFGAVLTGTLIRRIRHRRLDAPPELRLALDAGTGVLEIMEGRTRFYVRDGTGVPLVLLHSINAAASSFEMKPFFDYFAAASSRPIYALDWFGFGRSDRPPVRYSPSIYLRQLRRFLSEHVHQPADIVALSLSCEYAAQIASALPYLVRRVVMVSPTGLSGERETPSWRRAAVSVAHSIGAFELFFHRLTQEDTLRRFYENQIFRGQDVPADLVAYAAATARIRGAHHAPSYFIQNQLSTRSPIADGYGALRVPALMVVPEDDSGLIQRFDQLDDVLAWNPEHLRAERYAAGLMPHWEVPETLFASVDAFLNPA